jgi:hypothetical protein
MKKDRQVCLLVECLSRQSSLVINIVGTDDISRLPRLATGLTDDGRGGGGGNKEVYPTPRCPVYTPQSVVLPFPATLHVASTSIHY